MSGPKNTLFNYFKKVSSPSTSVSSPSATPKSTPSTPISQNKKRDEPEKKTPAPSTPISRNSKSVKKEQEKMDCTGDSQGRKRKRIRMMSSSEEEEDVLDAFDDVDDDEKDKDFKIDGKVSDESSEDEEEDVEESSPDSDYSCDSPPPKGKKRNTPAPKKTSKSSKKKSPSSEKENGASCNLSTPRIKNQLSAYASPALKKPKMDDQDQSDEPKRDRGDEDSAAREPNSFPHLSFPFLDPKNIKDKKKRRPDEEGYDATTIYIPESFLKEQTPAQRQWWELKSEHFDTVLFFKMGKFYELFHMDAVLSVEKCGLSLMKKDMPHAGFPEAAFQRYAEILVDLGYKVARIEQTETPAQMSERCAQMSRPSKFDKVVKREICQISSTGTRTQSANYECNFLTAICASKVERKIKIGIVFVDTSIGTFHIGNFEDDTNLSRLETLLSVYPPVEILYDRARMLPGVIQVIEKVCGSTGSRGFNSFPDPKKTLKMFSEKDYFDTKGKIPFEAWPKDLAQHLDEGDSLGLTGKPESSLGLMSLGCIANYLQEALIDQYIFSLKKFVNVNPIDVDRNLSKIETKDFPPGSSLILDQKSLKNLDIISAGGKPSLFTVLDKTSTAMGKRLLYTWTCMPLLRIDEIEDRQKCLRFLNDRPKLIEEIRGALKGLPDIEKLMAAIHTAGVRLTNHPECRAVYYEQAANAKSKISRLVSCLEGLTTINQLVEKVQDDMSENPSKILKYLVLDENGGNFPVEISTVLTFFNKAFNRKEALTLGKIIPKRGVDEAYDKVQEERTQFEEDSEAYLRQQKKFFGADVKYFGNGNQAFQLEVPEHACSRANKEYTMSSQRKGFKRYTTFESKELFARNVSLEEEEAVALAEVSRNIFCKFSEKKHLWEVAVQAVAQLDALLSLHDYSFGLDSDSSCFAKFLRISCDEKPSLKIVEGRHPIVIATNPDMAFIPNNFELDDRLAILTGANMGGKSTLMRQTALLCVLAQMGCRVPASSMMLTPIDRIFTRIGAADNIFDRESTFMVELSETSVILKHANKHSLVLIDELGRGTTTFDGCAIAHGVSKYLLNRGSRTIFSTHYHELMREYVKEPNVVIYHMSVLEQEEEVVADGDKAIVFLYTVSPGPCSKSHGFNAARLAGLPAPIIERALKVAGEFEEEQNNLLELAQIIKAH